VTQNIPNPTNLNNQFGWGSATQANNLNNVPGNTLTYDVPGTVQSPSMPFGPTPPPIVGGGNTGPGSVGYAPAVAGHWNKTDFMSMVPGDWQVTGAEKLGNEQIGGAEAAFQRNLRQAFIDFGGDPTKLSGEFAKYLDPATIEAAKNNKYSQIAQNLKSYRRTLATKRAQLAGRGLTFSGANTGMTRNTLDARELADINASRAFLNPAFQGIDSLAQLRLAVEKANAEARAAAAARLAGQYPDTWVEGSPEVPGVDYGPVNPGPGPGQTWGDTVGYPVGFDPNWLSNVPIGDLAGTGMP